MRKPGPKREDDKPDLVGKHLRETIALLDRSRLAESGITPKKLAAEKARYAAKFDRRLAKTLAKWDRMTILERQAWGETYLSAGKPTEGYTRSLPREASDLRMLFAVVRIAERDRREREQETPADHYELHRPAVRAPEDVAPNATSPSPAPEAPPADTEPPKSPRPRKRRQGPDWGPIGQQIDGVFYPYITDEDD